MKTRSPWRDWLMLHSPSTPRHAPSAKSQFERFWIRPRQATAEAPAPRLRGCRVPVEHVRIPCAFKINGRREKSERHPRSASCCRLFCSLLLIAMPACTRPPRPAPDPMHTVFCDTTPMKPAGRAAPSSLRASNVWFWCARRRSCAGGDGRRSPRRCCQARVSSGRQRPITTGTRNRFRRRFYV